MKWWRIGRQGEDILLLEGSIIGFLFIFILAILQEVPHKILTHLTLNTQNHYSKPMKAMG